VKEATGTAVGVKGRIEFESLDVGRLRTTSMVRGFVDAIEWLLVVYLLEEGDNKSSRGVVKTIIRDPLIVIGLN